MEGKLRDTILFGDCRDTLKEFDEKAQMCVTSPPYYGLRNYGDEENQIGLEQSPEEYIRSKTWVASNYLCDSSRKPWWI